MKKKLEELISEATIALSCIELSEEYTNISKWDYTMIRQQFYDHIRKVQRNASLILSKEEPKRTGNVYNLFDK